MSEQAGHHGTGHPTRPLGRARALQVEEQGPFLSGFWPPWKTGVDRHPVPPFSHLQNGAVPLVGLMAWCPVEAGRAGAGTGHAGEPGPLSGSALLGDGGRRGSAGAKVCQQGCGFAT